MADCVRDVEKMTNRNAVTMRYDGKEGSRWTKKGREGMQKEREIEI